MLRISIILAAVLLFAVNVGYADEQQEQKAALESFQPILNKYVEFFMKNPKLLVKVSPPEDVTIKTYSVHQFIMRRVYYDILKSNSIVTPYNSFIDVDTEVLDNKPCGNVSFNKKDKEGWADINGAINNSDAKNCFVSRTRESGPIQHRFYFDYSALRGKWYLSNITYKDGKANGRFMAVIGVASSWFPIMDESQALEFNKDWIDLFKNQ